MRRTLVTVALGMVLLAAAAAAAAPALAAGLGAPTFRDRLVEEFDDTNFCGTGQTVHVVNTVVANGWEGDGVFRLAFTARGTYTFGDATVTDHWAGRAFDVIVEGVEEGPHTHVTTETGLRAFLKAPGIGRVTCDAGNIQFRVSFDADDNVVDFEVVHDHGDHPDFYDPVWCDAAIECWASRSRRRRPGECRRSVREGPFRRHSVVSTVAWRATRAVRDLVRRANRVRRASGVIPSGLVRVPRAARRAGRRRPRRTPSRRRRDHGQPGRRCPRPAGLYLGAVRAEEVDAMFERAVGRERPSVTRPRPRSGAREARARPRRPRVELRHLPSRRGSVRVARACSRIGGAEHRLRASRVCPRVRRAVAGHAELARETPARTDGHPVRLASRRDAQLRNPGRSRATRPTLSGLGGYAWSWPTAQPAVPDARNTVQVWVPWEASPGIVYALIANAKPADCVGPEACKATPMRDTGDMTLLLVAGAVLIPTALLAMGRVPSDPRPCRCGCGGSVRPPRRRRPPSRSSAWLPRAAEKAHDCSWSWFRSWACSSGRRSRGSAPRCRASSPSGQACCSSRAP